MVDRDFRLLIKKSFLKSLLIFTVCLISAAVQGQHKKIVQLSGLIVSGDSMYSVHGAYIFAPKTGRGTTSNYAGYFSLPALTGDTLYIKAIGYKQKKYVVPEVEEKASVLLELTMDTTFLPGVEIFPWATEKEFKQAFLALNLNNTDYLHARSNLNPQILNRGIYNLPDDGSMNHRYFLNHQSHLNTSVPTFNLVDPIAWRKFFKSVKKGELKQQEKDQE